MSMLSENRTERINVLVTPSEKAAIEAMAKEGGVRVSDFVRRAVLTPYPDESALEEIKALADAVGGVAQRLDQKLEQGLRDIAVTKQAIADLREASQ